MPLAGWKLHAVFFSLFPFVCVCDVNVHECMFLYVWEHMTMGMHAYVWCV